MRALKVPFEVDPTGRSSSVEGEYPVLATYLRMLLLTRIGERVMRPTYGSMLQESLFEGIDDVFIAELDGDVRDAVRDWEPDVEIVALNFETVQESRINVELVFRVRSNLSGETSAVAVEIDAGGTVEEMDL